MSICPSLMQRFILLFVLVLSVTASTIASSSSVSSSSSLSSSDSSSATAFDNTAISSNDDDYDYNDDGEISDQELCECFDIDFFYTDVPQTDKICYFYIFKLASTESYCSQIINYIALETNQDECSVTIDDVLLSTQPDCCINTDFNGASVDGIQITFNAATGDTNADSSSSVSLSSSDSSDSLSSSDSSSSSQQIDSSADDPVIFSLCFDASIVGGTQHSAQLEIQLGANIFVCDVSNILPDLCGNVPSDSTTTSPPTDPDTAAPSSAPTHTRAPSISPTSESDPPTADPTSGPTNNPTTSPTRNPTKNPTLPPTSDPTKNPSDSPTSDPSKTPTESPTNDPTKTPTDAPSTDPTVTPTDSPTLAPVYTVCATDDAWNIAWLLDESGSVDAGEWDNTIEFVDRIMQYDVPATSYSTFFEFASYPGFSHFLDWTPVEDPVGSGDRSAFTDALQNNPYNTEGFTYTWDAVNRVLDEFWDYRFTCNDGCDTRQDVLIVMTDGRPTDQVCPNITARVNQTDIDIIVIGVGLTPAQLNSVSCLDARDGGADVLSIDNYDDISLRSLELEVRTRLCTGTDPVIPSERPANGTQWRYDDGSIGLGPVPTRHPGGAPGNQTDTFF